MTASKLRIAFAIERLVPAGGLEQHALRLADLLVQRGHEVTLITTRAPAQPPPNVAVREIPGRGSSNHGRMAAFAEDAAAAAREFDRSLVFHPVPGFDVVFCANPSRAQPSPLRALLPRYRAYAELERQAFAPGSRATVLCLSGVQRDAIARNNATPAERLVLLPPTVDRLTSDPPSPRVRGEARRALGLAPSSPVWLWMGLQPKTKGLDRAFTALAGAPDACLLITGLDPASGAGESAKRLARRLGVEARVVWLGFCDEAALRQAKAAADLLLHPARADVTGTVILEAMASGLPVITTEVCGYGEHVANADAGVVLSEPYRAADLGRALAAATPAQLKTWSANALAYAERDELFSGLERAADIIAGPAVAPAR